MVVFTIALVNQCDECAKNKDTQASSNGCNQPRFHKKPKIYTKSVLVQQLTKKMAQSDCKSLLQEYTQKSKIPLPTYATVEFGEAHNPSFQASVVVAGTCYSGEVCKRKKLAEIEAAKIAMLAIFSSQDESPSTNISNPQKKCKANTKMLRLMFQRKTRSFLIEMMLKKGDAKVKKSRRPKRN